MRAEENKAWLRDVYKRLDAGDPGIVEEAWDSNWVGHYPGQELRGSKGYGDLVAAFRMGLPDFEHNIEVMMAADDMVAAHFVIAGTHKGELLGKAPTGKKVAFTSTAIFRLRSGKIVEQWCDFDVAGLTTQLSG